MFIFAWFYLMEKVRVGSGLCNYFCEHIQRAISTSRHFSPAVVLHAALPRKYHFQFTRVAEEKGHYFTYESSTQIVHFIIWEQKDLSLPTHSFAQDPPFCTLLFSVPVPVMAMALSPCALHSSPCVCVQILPIFYVLPQISPPGHLPQSLNQRPWLLLGFLWPGQQERFL